MRKENVRVAIWGFGAMGSGMGRLLLTKKGVEIVGVCCKNPASVGRDMYDYLGVDRGARKEIIITTNIDDVVKRGECDICLCCTDSFVKNAFEKIKSVLLKGVNVVSIAEEMAYPKAQNAEFAKELDRIAKENNVTVLGTGINPGLMMDLLVVALTGAMSEVTHIKAERVNSLSPFGEAVMVEQGIGLTEKEFLSKMEEGDLAGHVGFAESIEMVADAIGWKLEKPIRQEQAPITTKVYRETPCIKVEAGNVAGCSMKGFGTVDSEEKIEMIHPQQIEPHLAGIDTGDYITLTGVPNISMKINPEVNGGLGTISMAVNMIPHVINARPGAKTMLDLPVPRAIMGDMRDLIED